MAFCYTTNMFESIILGAVQGVAEWLPVSSEAMIVLVKSNFFPEGLALSELISYAIFLHLGTVLAVLVYYRKTILSLLSEFFGYHSLSRDRKDYINFIIIATGTSGVLGLFLIKIIEKYEHIFHNDFLINVFVAGFLMITAVLLYLTEQKSRKKEVRLTKKRAMVTGFFQGLAAVPGISRSGSTVAGMGLLGIKKEQALELSFILSIPIVLLANIILNIHQFTSLSLEKGVALFSAFVFGLITIDLLLRIVRKTRFSIFVAFFAVLLIIVSFMIS